MTSLATTLFSRKRGDEQEFTLHLFEKCNLSCGFCWQDHSVMEGVDTVASKADIVNDMIAKDPKSAFSVSVMGGEIFDDSIFDDYLENAYVQMMESIHIHAQSLAKRVKFNLITNLVTMQRERIDRLIRTLRSKGIHVIMSTSYDTKGRFNRRQLETFKANVEYFRNEIDSISMVLSKPAIKTLLKKQDEYFDYLYNEGFYIYFDDYYPTDDHLVMGPSDKELLKAFYFLVDNYPNINPVKVWIENTTNDLSCRACKVVQPDGKQGGCGSLTAPTSQVISFFKKPISPTNNDAIEDNFLANRNCLECEYFVRCTVGCFMQYNFSKRGQLVECPIKLTFDKITKGIEVDIDSLPSRFGD